MKRLEVIEKIELSSLRAIKRQAEYNQTTEPEYRLELFFNHMNSLRNLQKEAKRV